jgi:xanthine permease XanP
MADPDELLFGLDDKPPLAKALVAAAAHLLAIVASIATAPLIIARGLNLTAELTSYVVASALIVSGFATFIQVYRIGPLGSGLLSVQGTSFAFVGIFIYAGLQLQTAGSNNVEVLGILIGTAGAGGLMTMALSFFIQRLQSIITLNVAGIVIFLLGLSLLGVAFGNLVSAADQAMISGGSSVPVWSQAAIVIAAITLLSSRKNVWLKLASICLGLGIGLVFAYVTGEVVQATPATPDSIVLLSLLPFKLGFDPFIFLLFLPIYLVTITESIGDLTATSMLSKRSVHGQDYWLRLRGGVLADGFNTVLASLVGTFPNTTFSQNNGVIKLTGVASRYVGLWLAGMLVLLGSVPAFSMLFQILPAGVLHGATGLMFAMIMLAGLRVLRDQPNQKRTMTMLVVCTVGAMVFTQATAVLALMNTVLPDYLTLLTSFPVASGAGMAILWEIIAPEQRH